MMLEACRTLWRPRLRASRSAHDAGRAIVNPAGAAQATMKERTLACALSAAVRVLADRRSKRRSSATPRKGCSHWIGPYRSLPSARSASFADLGAFLRVEAQFLRY